jgi:hypothetical protein
MMENFTQILRRLSMATIEESLTRCHFTSVTPFKVQVNFDIPLFEGQIDADSLEKWLNILEDYYSVQKKIESENITFAFLKSLPHVRSWWEGQDLHVIQQCRMSYDINPFKHEVVCDVYPLEVCDVLLG